METPQHMFFVPALNSFHSSRKTKVEARKRFQDVNDKKPKLPGLFAAFKSSKATKSSSPVVSVPIKKAHAGSSTPTKVTTRSTTTTRQLATPPPESQPPRAAPVVSTRRPSARVERPQVTKVKAPTEVVSKKNAASPVPSSRTKVVRQLPTPPSTPPLVSTAPTKTVRASSIEKAPKIARSNVVILPKSTPIPRSKPMLFKPEMKVAEASPRPFKEEERKTPAAPLAPKASRKLVLNSPTGKAAGPMPRTPVVIKTPAKSVKPITPKSRSPTKAVAPRVSSPVKVKESLPTATIVVAHKEVSAREVVSEKVTNTEIAVKIATAAVQCKAVEAPQPKATRTPSKNESVQANLVMEVEGSKMKEAATPNIVVLKTNKPASPLKAAHNPLVDELKAALERRKAVVGNWKPSQPKQEETSVERPPIRALSNAGSGIQARIAAMYASSGVKAPVQPTVVPMGAQVRQFKRPELLDSDKASSNARIQREIEALRGMNKVGAGGAAIVKTRAFGGSETTNAGAQETHARALPLHLTSIVERVRRERFEEATQEK